MTSLDPENWDTWRFLFAGIVRGLVLVSMLKDNCQNLFFAVKDCRGKPDQTTRPATGACASSPSCATVIDKDSCRDLFINASNCKILPRDGGDIDGCIKDRTMSWYDQNSSSLDNSCP